MPREHTGRGLGQASHRRTHWRKEGGNKWEDVQETEAQESLAAERVKRVRLRQHIQSEMFSLTFLQYGCANSLVLHGILISGLDCLPGISIPTPDPVLYVIRHITYALITSSCVLGITTSWRVIPQASVWMLAKHWLYCVVQGARIRRNLRGVCPDAAGKAWQEHTSRCWCDVESCVLELLQTMTRQGTQQLACIISSSGDSPECWAPTRRAHCQLQTVNYTDLECTVGWIQATY